MSILQDKQLIASRERHMAELDVVFTGQTPRRPFYLAGYTAQASADATTDPLAWAKQAMADLEANAACLTDAEVFRPLVFEKWLYGVHFTDKLFGAEVYFHNEQWWSKGLPNGVGELPEIDFETNPVWKQARDLTRAILSLGTTVPFITTQVLGGPFNQLFNLYKEHLLTGFYDNPAGVRRDLRVLTDALIYMHNWYRQTIPTDQFQPIYAAGRCMPRGYGQMCGCATQLISKELYDSFIRPLDEEVLSIYPNGGMYHLCGAHSQHLATWRDMPGLRAFQVNDRATEDFDLYSSTLREDQIFYVFPTANMTREKMLHKTQGKRTVFC
ncbi:MAG: hypothetical protein FWE88_03920 [Phycisphaerae bacterium]|nr:hypothetical protein [Phycisphaerae bacterium]